MLVHIRFLFKVKRRIWRGLVTVLLFREHVGVILVLTSILQRLLNFGDSYLYMFISFDSLQMVDILIPY